MGSNQDYSEIHCQILEDLQTLKVDQGSGCIIEFPLAAVSKVYRIVKNCDQWHSAGPNLPQGVLDSRAEHIVVVEFMRRKLAFVFDEIAAAQSFLMCMELLIRRAQECRRETGPVRHGNANGQIADVSNHFQRFDAKARHHNADAHAPKDELVSCACRSDENMML